MSPWCSYKCVSLSMSSRTQHRQPQLRRWPCRQKLWCRPRQNHNNTCCSRIAELQDSLGPPRIGSPLRGDHHRGVEDWQSSGQRRRAAAAAAVPTTSTSAWSAWLRIFRVSSKKEKTPVLVVGKQKSWRNWLVRFPTSNCQVLAQLRPY